MKNDVKKGILAGMILENMTEDQISFLLEQQEETKPSRLKNKTFNKKGKKRRSEDDDTYH